MGMLNSIMWYLLIFTIIAFIFNGTFQLFFDSYYWISYLINKIRSRHKRQATYYDFTLIPEKKIALMLPCWREEEIIGDMLVHNLNYLDYQNYDIFVGVYPNDSGTKNVVQELQKTHKNLYCIETSSPGPTTKADNLDSIFAGILKHEIAHKTHYDIFLMHDAEDIIHPFALKLYNYYIPEKPIVQTPVLPLKLSQKELTHWVYCDEFADLHTKELVVRDKAKGFVPSAGVGTAFSRQSLMTLASKNHDYPFSKRALTEDYDASLKLHMLNLHETFLIHKIAKLGFRKKWFFWGKEVPVKKEVMISTHALFPNRYRDAIKQRSRWIFGIAIQEWLKSGWPGGPFTKFLLFHDRKSIFTFCATITGYVVFIYWAIMYFWSLSNPNVETLANYLRGSNSVSIAIIACTILMLEYLIQRFTSTARVYGFGAALLSPVRVIYGNVINTHATMRAYLSRLSTPKHKYREKWAKTKNRFPTIAQLSDYEVNVNDLLLERKLIKIDALKKELKDPNVDHNKLSLLLLEHGQLPLEHLLQALSELSQMPLFAFNKNNILPLRKTPEIASDNYNWLIDHNFYPLKVVGDTLVVATNNVQSNDEQLKEMARKNALPYQVEFVLDAKINVY